MCRKEQEIAGLGAGIEFVEFLDGVNFTVPERIFRLVVGSGENDRIVPFVEQSGAEHLVASRDALVGQWQNVMLYCGQQRVDQAFLLFLHHDRIPSYVRPEATIAGPDGARKIRCVRVEPNWPTVD